MNQSVWQQIEHGWKNSEVFVHYICMLVCLVCLIDIIRRHNGSKGKKEHTKQAACLPLHNNNY
jgi:hypothetical protein